VVNPLTAILNPQTNDPFIQQYGDCYTFRWWVGCYIGTARRDLGVPIKSPKSKIAIFAPVKESPLEYCHNVWYENTRIALLTDSDKKWNICLFVSTEYTNVTDRRTDTA